PPRAAHARAGSMLRRHRSARAAGLAGGDRASRSMMNEQDEILALWFGALDARGRADDAHASRWWTKDEAFDAELRERFGALHEAIVRGEREAWLETPRGRLAYVIVLDQLSRNMF